MRARWLFFSVILFSLLFPSSLIAAETSFLCAGIGASRPVRDTDIRAKSVNLYGIPPEGQLHTVVIFAAFAGEQTSVPAYAADFFRPDLPGSLTHFYTAMSFGRLTLTGETLPKAYASREKMASSLALRDSAGLGTFTLEIIQQADREVDFGRYDSDGPDGIPNSGDDDGVVDCLFLNLQTMPTGFLKGGATGMAFLGFHEYTTNDRAFGRGFIRIFGRQGTIQRVLGFAHAVGSMAHEFGHLLGLPDLYDTEWETSEEESAGVGVWCLMGWGAMGWHNDGPNPFSAWCREQLGWGGEWRDRGRTGTSDRCRDGGCGDWGDHLPDPNNA